MEDDDSFMHDGRSRLDTAVRPECIGRCAMHSDRIGLLKERSGSAAGDLKGLACHQHRVADMCRMRREIFFIRKKAHKNLSACVQGPRCLINGHAKPKTTRDEAQGQPPTPGMASVKAGKTCCQVV